MTLEILPLGVGDSFSTRHHTASFLVRFGKEYLAIDCPDSYLRVLSEATELAGWDTGPEDIQRMVLTHIHGDHMNGLEGLAFYKHFVERSKLALWTSSDMRQNLWDERLKGAMSQLWNGTEFVSRSFKDYFDFQPLSWDEEIQAGPFRVKSRKTIHHVPTSALLISAGGKTVGYSADTAFDPSLIDFLKDADLIIHETNFGPAHTAYESLLGVESNVRERMRLIHYSDLFDVASSRIPVLREGHVVKVL